tara:strand:- start:3317 stop:4276 length:960 start_codon:yes stop_codon:yes gene_type:complete
MLILEKLTAEVPDTNAYHFNFKKFSNDDKKNVLMYGYDSPTNELLSGQLSDYRKIFFNNWAPCEFAQETDHNNKGPMNYDEKFDVIYSICPYTVEWLNSLKLGREYRYIFYPFCETLIPEQQEKKYDVIYHGGIHGKEHVDCINAISKFNYRYCTMTHHINNLTIHFLPYATNTNLPFKDKIKLVAQTKISICYNMVHVHKEHIPRIKSQPEYENNLAFSSIEDLGIMPQFKTRIHEAAISRTLNLVRRDKWNIIENYYTPNEHFVYFEDEVDLPIKLKEILNDWESYQPMIDNAYNKALEYTAEKFISKIQEDIESDL